MGQEERVMQNIRLLIMKKFVRKFNWKPKYDNLEYILRTALSWEKNI